MSSVAITMTVPTPAKAAGIPERLRVQEAHQHDRQQKLDREVEGLRRAEESARRPRRCTVAASVGASRSALMPLTAPQAFARWPYIIPIASHRKDCSGIGARLLSVIYESNT